MTAYTTTDLMIDRHYDARRGRHMLNGVTHVLHCHHYLSLYTQLAEDCGMLDGPKLLAEVAEDSFYRFLSTYYSEHQIHSLDDRIALAEQYYAFTGLGKMIIRSAGPDSGVVELEHSHVDAGWEKKWGRQQKPINHITRGYISALFAALFDAPPRTWTTREISAMITGADRSEFAVVRK